MQKTNYLRNHAFVNHGESDLRSTSLSYTRSTILSKSRRNSIRPGTPDSDLSSTDGKWTKDQHTCIQNVGIATAFILPIALIPALVAIGTNYWFNVTGDHVGLFRFCNNWTAECSAISSKYSNDSTLEQMWRIGVPLELSGVSILIVAMLCLACYPCHRKINFSKMACATVIAIVILIGTLAFVAGAATFTVYYFKETPDIEFSFYCNCAGAVLAFVAMVMFWIHLFYTACFDMD